jgi:hypothetical protein
VLQYLAARRIVAPGYTILQDLVSRVVTAERQRITRLLEQAITPDVQRQLQALLESDEGLYQLTILKHEPKDFSRKELRQEGERRRFFQPIYDFAQTFLSSSGVSNDSIRRFARGVLYHLQTQTDGVPNRAPLSALLRASSPPGNQRQSHRGVHSSGGWL